MVRFLRFLRRSSSSPVVGWCCWASCGRRHGLTISSAPFCFFSAVRWLALYAAARTVVLHRSVSIMFTNLHCTQANASGSALHLRYNKLHCCNCTCIVPTVHCRNDACSRRTLATAARTEHGHIHTHAPDALDDKQCVFRGENMLRISLPFLRRFRSAFRGLASLLPQLARRTESSRTRSTRHIY